MTLRRPSLRSLRHRLALALPIVMLGVATTLALASLALASLALADGEDGGTLDTGELTQRAVDADPAVAEAAVAALRAMGPSGHAALLREHAATIVQLREAVAVPADPALAERVRHAIDVVSAQRDGHASGLYWHTDLDAARAESRRTGRPILSLRLLGRLDEELSCANSRFFRVILYPNRGVSSLLASRFVLHWSSERPAPRITIDMGDGRRIERTITGNSAHYVLDASGRPIDVLPGLYAPVEFRVALERALAIASRCGGATPETFAGCMRERHETALAELQRGWDVRRARSPSLPSWDELVLETSRGDAAVAAPSAIEGMEVTQGKMSIERPMLEAMQRQRAPRAQPLTPISWETAATPELATESLDTSSLGLLRLKTGVTDLRELAPRIARVAAIDGIRNEMSMHRRVHEWLARDPSLHSFAPLNTRVYAELFLTPASDPWLGLDAAEFWDLVEIER